MRRRIITFTNLFPSPARPTFGLFVFERMRRVVEELGVEWQVVCPVPRVPRLLRRAADRTAADLPQLEEFEGVPVHHPKYFHLPAISTGRQATRMYRAASPTVRRLLDGARCVLDVHYVYPDGVAALRIGAELGVPCVVTARGTDVNVLAAMPRVAAQIRRTAGSAHALLAVSEPLRRRFAAVAGVRDEQVRLVRNGVDLDRFRPGDPAAARRELGLSTGGRLVVGVGQLLRTKGFQDMAAALHRLPDDVRLALVGEGPDRDLIARQAPAGRLSLLGSRLPAEVALAYQAADVVVLPSVREGWPNVVIEALASGVPVVATAVGGIPDILTSPRAGALVRVGDIDALAREVSRFLGMSRDAEAIRRFAERFSWSEPVRALCALFEEALR